MAGLEFDWSDLEKFEKEINKWPTLALNSAIPAMQDAVHYLHAKLPESPQASSEVIQRPDGASFLTDKQRRWFFWAVQNNQIPGWRWVESAVRRMISPETRTAYAKFESVGGGHPEKFASGRSGELERRFTTDVKHDESSVTGSFGTNSPYAPWVVGPAYPGEEIEGEKKYQAKIHEGRWWVFGDVVKENLPDAWAEFDKTFWPLFNKGVAAGQGAS